MTFCCHNNYNHVFILNFIVCLAVDSWQRNVFFQSLSSQLAEKHVEYCPVSSPPVLSADENNDMEGLNYQLGSPYEMWSAIVGGVTIVLMGSSILSGKEELSFSLQKKKITRDHRRECYSLIERIFGDGPSLDGDLIVINFFALVF